MCAEGMVCAAISQFHFLRFVPQGCDSSGLSARTKCTHALPPETYAVSFFLFGREEGLLACAVTVSGAGRNYFS